MGVPKHGPPDDCKPGDQKGGQSLDDRVVDEGGLDAVLDPIWHPVVSEPLLGGL